MVLFTRISHLTACKIQPKEEYEGAKIFPNLTYIYSGCTLTRQNTPYAGTFLKGVSPIRETDKRDAVNSRFCRDKEMPRYESQEVGFIPGKYPFSWYHFEVEVLG